MKRKCLEFFWPLGTPATFEKVLLFVKEILPRTVVFQLTRKDGAIRKKILEIADFFSKSFLAGSKKLVTDYFQCLRRILGFQSWKIEKLRKSVYQQTPYKAIGPDNTETIAIWEDWKVGSCR